LLKCFSGINDLMRDIQEFRNMFGDPDLTTKLETEPLSL